MTVPARHRYVDAAVPDGFRHVGRDRVRDWEVDPVWSDPSVLHEADLVHVHFGFDHLAPAVLAEWCARLPVPLVVTVHDLRNPHHAGPDLHTAQLQVLLERADAVLTLTPGAAAEIARAYGRRAEVVEHGRIYDGPDGPTEPGLVGIALKSLRRNVVDPARLVRVVADATNRAGGRLEVTAHRVAADDPRMPGVDAALRAAGAGAVRWHDYLSDAGHQRSLSRLHVAVLVNRWGTHSGWLEACRDVGTRVVAPDCGRYAEQWPAVETFRHDEGDGLDEDSLTAAVTRAVRAAPTDPAGRGLRELQRARSDEVHRAVYRGVCVAAAA